MSCKLSERVQELEEQIEEMRKAAGDRTPVQKQHAELVDQLYDFLERECECEEVRTIIDKLTLLRRTLDSSEPA